MELFAIHCTVTDLVDDFTHVFDSILDSFSTPIRKVGINCKFEIVVHVQTHLQYDLIVIQPCEGLVIDAVL